MNKLIRLLGAVLFCAASLVALAATEANRLVEFTFESAKPYQDPFNEITLDAVFTDPSGGKRRVPAFWAGGATWREAMNLPGSTQLSKAKAFLLKLPWPQLAPATNIFTGAVSAASTADGRCALAYTTGGKPLTVDLSKLKGSLNARWFDPTSGELKAIPGAPFAASASREFAPPGNNAAGDGDWVLVLEAK